MLAQQNDIFLETCETIFQKNQDRNVRYWCEAREEAERIARTIERERQQDLAALAEKDNIIQEQSNALAEKDNALAEKNNALAEKDNTIQEQSNALAELRAQIAALMTQLNQK